MKRITTFVGFAVFAFVAGSSAAMAEQSNGTQPARLNAPREQAPVPAIKPIQENRIPKQIRSATDVGAGRDEPQQRSRTDRPPLMGIKHLPSSGVQQVRPRAVYREVARRINIAGGVLVLPVVVYYGVPVILNVPELGYVDVQENRRGSGTFAQINARGVGLRFSRGRRRAPFAENTAEKQRISPYCERHRLLSQ